MKRPLDEYGEMVAARAAKHGYWRNSLSALAFFAAADLLRKIGCQRKALRLDAGGFRRFDAAQSQSPMPDIDGREG